MTRRSDRGEPPRQRFVVGDSIAVVACSETCPVLRQNWRSAVVGHDRECLRRQLPYDRDGLTALTF
jgi:hypothetical protein